METISIQTDNIIMHRPWGYYISTARAESFQTKVIVVHPSSQLSLQSHQHREEHWIVISGNGLVQIGESTSPVSRGDSVFIPKGTKHRLENTDNKEDLIITEVQIGDYLGEDDIIRYQDIYGRV